MQSNLDLDNLLVSAEIGVLYLDKALVIRKITPLMYRHTQLAAEDVGRKLSEICFMEEYNGLQADVESCMLQDAELEREIVQDETVILLRISPYRNGEGLIEGAMVLLFDITSRRRKEEELWENSRKDSMTGLLNHAAAQKRVEEGLERLAPGQTAYLIICDVDNFKQINDTNGHFFGDGVICSFAEQLDRQLPDAVKGRIGGDEFLAYVEDMGRGELERRLGEINHFMSDRYGDDKMGQVISSSVGVAVVTAGQSDYQVVFQWADNALYRVKNGHKGSYVILEVPKDMSLPKTGYLDRQKEPFEDIEGEMIHTEEELVTFCQEILENVENVTAALKMISERTCRFYNLDDMVCVEHQEGANHALYQWSDVEKTEFAQSMEDPEVYGWEHLRHLTDPAGCVICRAKQMPGRNMQKAQSALLVLSTSVRDYHGSVVFADRSRERDWVRMKTTLMQISSKIFYRMRALKQESERRHALDLKLNYDGLTGLSAYNRFILDAAEYLEDNRGGELYCIYTDFSGFRYFNEIYGYEMGDGILRRFAEALLERYEGNGIFSRISSDHFVGIVRRENGGDAAEEYRDFTINFAAECNRDFPLTNLALASGLYQIRGEDSNVGAIVDNANEARKTCKEHQVETVVRLYTDELRQELENIRAINSNILKGLKNEEFIAYLQPKVSLKSGRIVGAEALARWIRPDGSRVMPRDFIEIAEKNGYITRIDFQILDQVIAYLREAVETGEEVVPVSVNFSRRNNEFEDFVPNILKRLEENHIPRHLLEAEVTESVFMADLGIVDDNMKRLRTEGVDVSVDDFGSGYSSLNLLAKVSADTIKLDRLFLDAAGRDERGQTVIRYLTGMLKSLGFTVLAEGVETEEQLKWMRTAGCDLIQGFYYAKPMSIEDFKIFLKEYNSKKPERV